MSKRAKSTSANSYIPFHYSDLAAITKLILDFKREQQTTPVFISQDLSAMRYLADRVVVKFLGPVMEQGQTEAVFSLPYHPYTEVSLSSITFADPTLEKRWIIHKRMLPSLFDLPAGHAFATRCPRRIGSIYGEETPSTLSLAGGHQVASNLSRDEREAVEPVIAIKATAS